MRNKAFPHILCMCTECGSEFHDRETLLKVSTLSSIGEHIIYPCNQCDYLSKSKTYLRQHIKSKHEGFSLVFFRQRFVKYHIQSNQGGMKVRLQTKIMKRRSTSICSNK